jgi:adenosylcobinamide-phosphate synthase
MGHFLIAAMAIFIDRLFGESVRSEALQVFGKMASFIEQSWFGQEELIVTKGSQGSQLIELLVRFKGTLALFFLVLPFLAITLFLDQFPVIGFIFDVFILYLSIGAYGLKQHALAIHKELTENNLDKAAKELSSLVGRSTIEMNQQNILIACIRSVLKNGNNAIIGPLFWFFLFGAPGAVLYRLVNVLAVMWNYQNPRFKNFGLAANYLDSILNFLPDLFTALNYVVLGKMKTGWQCLLKQGKSLGPTLAAGIGTLNIEASQQLPDIKRACDLVDRSMMLALAIFFILSLIH